MKKITTIFFCSIFVLFHHAGKAQDTTVNKAVFESIVKKTDSVKIYADSLKKLAKNTDTKTKATEATVYGPGEITNLVIIISFFLIVGLLLFKFFRHLKDNDQRIGYQSIKLIGLILIFPGVCILAVGGQGILKGETLAALFGTIAGYVLSREDDNKDNSSLAASKKAEEELKAKIKTLEENIKSIKDKNPNLIQ